MYQQHHGDNFNQQHFNNMEALSQDSQFQNSFESYNPYLTNRPLYQQSDYRNPPYNNLNHYIHNGQPELQYTYQLKNDFHEEDSAESSSLSKKRKHTHTKSSQKKSILEDLLELLDDGNYGIQWFDKVDTEGDIQDSIHIYQEDILENTLKERRGVKNYGLSKHLAKDLRYYGFMYDKENKMFWNEDNKDKVTKKSYWQRDDRSKCHLLKRITGEEERNNTRLLSLVSNVELAEALKYSKICQKVCPLPSKYINLKELSLLIPGVTKKDIHNILLFVSHSSEFNDIVKAQLTKEKILLKEFDKLLSRIGVSHTDFLINFREFVSGAKEWYHGNISSNEANDLLKNKKGASFLIRESALSNCYTLSYTDQNNHIVKHMRLTQTSAGFSVKTDREPSRSLYSWIINHHDYIKYPVESKIYSKLIVQNDPPCQGNGIDFNLPKGYINGFPG